MKKLPDGRVVECKCGMCRTMPKAEEVLNPIDELPPPMRWLLYSIYIFTIVAVIGSFVYVWGK